MSTMTATRGFVETEPRAIEQWVREGSCALIDVREPDEFARERIAGSRLMPLSKFEAESLSAPGVRRLVFHCKGGRRSAEAAQRAAMFVAPDVEVHSMRGGIEQWKADGLPVQLNAEAPRLSVMQQVQLIIGTGVLGGMLLGHFAHPAGYLLTAFMGCGLLMAGLTGSCPLASLVAKLPWNRTSTSCCASGTCG
jgi:rhodanese-related sulfurtransferase